VVDVIECEYFSMAQGFRLDSTYPHIDYPGSFVALIGDLPVNYMVKVILMDNFTRETGEKKWVRPRPEPSPEKRWRTLDPVEMEAWEREQYLKGHIRVKRMRHVDAKVTRMRPGNRLRGILGMSLIQSLPYTTMGSLASIAQLCAFSHHRLLRGDLLDDFHAMISAKLLDFDASKLMLYAVAFSHLFQISSHQALLVCRRRLLPAVWHVVNHRTPYLLDQQRGFHPWLRGVYHTMGEPSSEASRLDILRLRTERAAQLFISVATAKIIALDAEMYDALVAPLKYASQQWLALCTSTRSKAKRGHVNGAEIHADVKPPLFSLETIADVLDAYTSCGVSDNTLPAILASLFVKQFGHDISTARFDLSSYSMSDLCAVAHAVGVLCDTGEECLDLLWLAAQPKIKKTQPHLILMMLNAIIHSGSEALLTSQAFIDTVDEHLSQRIDYDPDTLGRLGD